jgi:hypothetical protein
MPLYEMTSDDIIKIPTTTFEAEQILERADLQRLLKDRIQILAPDVLVVSEEFGGFADVKRRIDLLGVDRKGHLVVFELKRTEDGGHLELQALRYAAMVSTMTFEDLAAHYELFLRKAHPEQAGAAQHQLAEWLDEAGGAEAEISREVRLVLVAAGFDPEITTTVLWLNDVYGLDIRCIRLHPYKLDHRLLLDVEQLIPLPEAQDLTVKLRKREAKARETRTSGPDWTQYVVVTPGGRTQPMRKRRAILAMVEALAQDGVSLPKIAAILPSSKMLHVTGEFTGDQLDAALVAKYPSFAQNRIRWFTESPLAQGGETWVLSNQWGTQTEQILGLLATMAAHGGFGFEAVADNPDVEA